MGNGLSQRRRAKVSNLKGLEMIDFLTDERIQPVILIVVLSICYLAVHRYFVRAAVASDSKKVDDSQ